MSQVYELKTAGTSPLDLAVAKSFMKVSSASEDALIQSLIGAATEWGQKYTGREFTDNTWKLLLDEFTDRITLNRDPVETITSIKYLVSDVLTAVLGSKYYLKKLVQCSEILLVANESWPTDIDDREQAIEIEFVTKSYYCESEILEALKRHVAYLYSNRNDCPEMKEAASSAGSTFIYDQFRISRI